ncbi:ABC transporter permease [Bradyrhizobium sp. LTSPM299]|uniref:ABC transporter permease n=1 Tax=Bradyrhizobium sp. LTSPM299 TaxID=1619233 RepID=UPI0005CA936F|nr:ABC transporter permease [Bradyrhizobium sp. LTSPM299]KJC54087.1 ABC transporter permease [Bradyrhizobium sp. LTSPM299]
MSYFAFLNILEAGFLFGLVALGVYISFRILAFPDMTVDGSFATGAAVAAALVSKNGNPWLATALAVLIGMVCGLITAVLNRRFGMLHLLAGILTTIGLFSVDLRIMASPNIPLMTKVTVLTPFMNMGLAEPEVHVVFAGVVCITVAILLALFLMSEFGLAMRATGINPRMTRANGSSIDMNVYVGLALSNGLVALAGALFAQAAGFADVSMGSGTILFGLAAVILGEVLLQSSSIMLALLACIAGSILYRLAVGLALNSQFLGFQSSDLRLVTAALVAVAFVVSAKRGKWSFRRRKKVATPSEIPSVVP